MSSRSLNVWIVLSLLLVTPLLLLGCGDDGDEGSDNSNALEFLGRIDQNGPSFTGYGYVTHVDGVKDSLLFDSAPLAASDKTARLTFRFKTRADSRAVLEDVFALHSSGTIEFFHSDEPAADFDSPDSFADGEKVGSGSLDVQNIITVYAPNKGISDTAGSLSLDEVSEFEIDGEQVSIGETGDLRLTLAGGGTRSNAVLPRAVIDFAGQAAGDE